MASPVAAPVSAPVGVDAGRAGSSIVRQTTRRGPPLPSRATRGDPRAAPAMAAHARARSAMRPGWRVASSTRRGRRRSRSLDCRWHAEAAGRPKAPVAFAAPLPVGMAAEAELMDVLLCDRWPAWRAREALMGAILPGWSLTDVEDVWLGAPALAAAVCAADYRIALGGDVDAASLADAAERVIGARSVFRTREKGGSSVRYDLRPLLESVEIGAGSAGRAPGPHPVRPATRQRAPGGGRRGARRRARPRPGHRRDRARTTRPDIAG